MQDRFKDVPQDKDTSIVFQTVAKFEDKDILYQKWSSEGIMAESIIFFSTDIEGMSDEKLERYIKSGDMVNLGSQITIKRGEKYTFVNFNFKIKG